MAERNVTAESLFREYFLPLYPEEARSDPALLHDAPHSSPVRRLDEVKAARELRTTARERPRNG